MEHWKVVGYGTWLELVNHWKYVLKVYLSPLLFPDFPEVSSHWSQLPQTWHFCPVSGPAQWSQLTGTEISNTRGQDKEIFFSLKLFFSCGYHNHGKLVWTFNVLKHIFELKQTLFVNYLMLFYVIISSRVLIPNKTSSSSGPAASSYPWPPSLCVLSLRFHSSIFSFNHDIVKSRIIFVFLAFFLAVLRPVLDLLRNTFLDFSECLNYGRMWGYLWLLLPQSSNLAQLPLLIFSISVFCVLGLSSNNVLLTCFENVFDVLLR